MPYRSRASLVSIALVAAAVSAPPGRARADAPRADAAAATAMSSAELGRLLAPIDDPRPEVRRAAADAVRTLDADATPAIGEALATLRRTSTDIEAVLKGSPRERGDQVDLVEVLLKETPTGGDGYRVCLATAALVQALGRIGTFDAARLLVPVTQDHDGVFRAEVTRQMKRLGDRAVPALVVARKDASPAVRRWANALLDFMGKARTGDLVQTKSDIVLADTLRAFAEVRDVDAVGVVIAFVGEARPLVQAAARDALVTYGDDALPKLREAYANVAGKPAPPEWNGPTTARALFAAYDRVRLHDVYALVDDGLARQREGKLDEAVALFDKALARQPLLDRRAEMVSAYVQFAHSREDADRESAVAYYRKAERLDPAGPEAARVESAIATLDAEDLLARGIADTDAFRRAVALDPANARARGELERLESDAVGRRARAKRWAIAAALLLAAIVTILLFGRSGAAAAPESPDAP